MSRRFIWIAATVTLAFLAAGIWSAVVLLQPAPPRTVVMTTGPEGSAFAEFAYRYREVLAREGFELRLLPSAGAVENLERLNDGRAGVSVGFVQGGISGNGPSHEVYSLGTVSYEPLWFFYRDVDLKEGLKAFQGKRISIGAPGSGGRALASELLKRNGVDASLAEWLPYNPLEAQDKLLAGEIQAVVIVTSWDSPVVQRLLTAEDVHLVSFPRADAYVALYPYLNKLVLPQGVADLARNRPPADTLLLAPKASLAVRSDLHPAIQYLLLDAAEEVHSRPGIFQHAGEFPAAESIDFPLSDSARQFYKSGRPFLQRYLPFWLAVLVRNLLVVLIPVAGVLYPLLRVAPAAYAWAMRRRIFRLYRELKLLEARLIRRGPNTDIKDLAQRLDRLEERAHNFRVPASFASMLYTLRDHIGMVRARFESALRATANGGRAQ